MGGDGLGRSLYRSVKEGEEGWLCVAVVREGRGVKAKRRWGRRGWGWDEGREDEEGGPARERTTRHEAAAAAEADERNTNLIHPLLRRWEGGPLHKEAIVCQCCRTNHSRRG